MRPQAGSPSRRPRRAGRERGQIGGFEVLPFGILMFVSIMLIVVNAWAVIDAKLAVNAAAREAARAYVEAPSAAEADAAAQARATETLVSYGRNDAGRVTIGAVETDGGFARCARASVTVTYRVPALTVPFIGGLGSAITARSTHSELVDAFRSGLPAGGCP